VRWIITRSRVRRGNALVWRTRRIFDIVINMSIRDRTAIAGIGWTDFSKNSGRSVAALAADASLKAIDDAGLRVEDIDGLVGYFWYPDTVSPRELARNLGLTRCNLQVFDAQGGGWACASVAIAAMAVFTGLCMNVLVYRASNSNSDRRTRSPDASGPSQWDVPFGAFHAATIFGQQVTAHMAEFGTTTTDFAHLAVTQRRHATLNCKAMMRRPLTLADHAASPWVIYPFRLLDCCLQSDGAVAVVVTSIERARDLRQSPVPIMAAIGGAAPAGTGTPAPAAPRLWETNAQHSAPLLYSAAGIDAAAIDFAELYDPFTGMCLLHMEGFGLVPPGQSGQWVRAGGNGLDGDVPVNTHGGLLSEAHTGGLGHVVEAVQQLRRDGVRDDLCAGPHTYDRAQCRQVRRADIGLICGESGDSALLLRRA
jgi:acetyl-CoA acetyltransferase